jgi:hypothetical protein
VPWSTPDLDADIRLERVRTLGDAIDLLDVRR